MWVLAKHTCNYTATTVADPTYNTAYTQKHPHRKEFGWKSSFLWHSKSAQGPHGQSKIVLLPAEAHGNKVWIRMGKEIVKQTGMVERGKDVCNGVTAWCNSFFCNFWMWWHQVYDIMFENHALTQLFCLQALDIKPFSFQTNWKVFPVCQNEEQAEGISNFHIINKNAVMSRHIASSRFLAHI